MTDPSDGPISRLNAALEGRYRIDREIGQGGMATVYLADDLKHERNVALKVLKPELAAVVGAERFLAEIKTTANLNHPHILPLHDSGEADGGRDGARFLYFVMPYVQGDTLRDKIDREKQLSVGEAVEIATKIASALDYAHEHGVVHRDIKPGNILLSERGEPTVADFGIALAVAQAGGGRVTETGLSVGTPHYMSPEQATGDRDVDPRTDVYALGCVLYEMLIGEPPYTGSTAQAVLGKIIQGVPVSATEARGTVPPHVDAAIRKALEKLPADRFGSAEEFSAALADPAFRHGEMAGVAAGVGPWKRLGITFASLFVLTSAVAAWALLQPDPSPRVERLEPSIQEGLAISTIGGVNLAISPDGSRIVFVGTSESVPRLWQRLLSQLSATPIPGTEDARDPRFSPDGRTLVFHRASGTLHTVGLDGAPPQTIVPDSVRGSQAWGPDGWIYFHKLGHGIWRVPEIGGEPEEVTVLGEEETEHEYLDVLPDGNGVLYTRQSGSGTGGDVFGGVVSVVSLSSGDIRALFEGQVARYAASGHIVYVSPEGRLSVVPFDADRLEVTGPSRTLQETVWNDRQFALAPSGDLLYVPGLPPSAGVSPDPVEFVSITGAGAEPVDPGWGYRPPSGLPRGWSLSPDGSRVALTHEVDGNADVWIKNLDEGTFERLTDTDQAEGDPVWSPDGASVTFVTLLDDASSEVWQMPANGGGEAELLLSDARDLAYLSWASGGEWLVSHGWDAGGPSGIFGFRPGVDTAAVPLLASSEFVYAQPALSPDGRWLAYFSDRTGRAEIYVSPFPDVGSARVLVSTQEAVSPSWSRDGSELYYEVRLGPGDSAMRVARVDSGEQFRVLERETLFRFGIEYVVPVRANHYDLLPDDETFLMARSRRESLAAGSLSLVLVQNFFEELRQVVPE